MQQRRVSTRRGCRCDAVGDAPQSEDAVCPSSSQALPRAPLATGNGMRAIVPKDCMTRIVAGGNAYWHQRGVEVMKMSGSAGVRDNDDDLSSGSFKHSQDLRLGLEPGFVAEAVVPVVAGRTSHQLALGL